MQQPQQQQQHCYNQRSATRTASSSSSRSSRSGITLSLSVASTTTITTATTTASTSSTTTETATAAAAASAGVPVTAAYINDIKVRLDEAFHAENMDKISDLIIKLEKSNLTKEILEVTRIGATVNEIRRSIVKEAPELSRRCRNLIKYWQKLADIRPASSVCSSANATPNYASPAIRKGLTPGLRVTPGSVTSLTSANSNSRLTPGGSSRLTPGGSSRLTPGGSSRLTPGGSSRLTPAGNTDSRNNAVSPTIPNGRKVTPQSRFRPEMSTATAGSENMRKSYTVGADLASKVVDSILPADEIVRNGKRKAESTVGSDAGSITNGLSEAKRRKYNSALTSPAVPHQSLRDARRADLKTTSELVAQLTENLPCYLSFDLSNARNATAKEHEFNDKRQTELNTGHNSTASVVWTIQPETAKKKEKRSRPKKDKQKEKEGRKKDQSAEDEKVEIVHVEKASTSVAKETESVTTSSAPVSDLSSSREIIAPIRNGRYDWNAMLPTLETLRYREQLRAKPSSDPRKSYIMDVLGRKVLALPYIDIGMPDFLEYNFPESGKFYAEENFIYGAPRPS